MSVPGVAILLLSLIIFTGSSEALSISSSQSHVQGTRNNSLLLSISYSSPETNWIQIKWELLDSNTELVRCTIRETNSSSMEESLNIKMFPPKGYEGRMNIIPKNGSLVIRHLAQNDNGIYRVTLRDSNTVVSTTINVTVEEPGKSISSVWEHAPAIPNNTKMEMEMAPYCFCTSNSSSVSLPATAGIILGSRIVTILLTVAVFIGLGSDKKPPRRYIRKYYGPSGI
ncbi:hepatocyte cell adhesion molecule-like [Xenopus laevis]|uniref:Hepatocyte cell adhesion molecule-like n=1 Tax=Xenopus laevis TaxID=8355 RepID=A0A8J1M0N2_XENLA|nr:hepatocyte cell adhesion molecule-like [Xenopus laevis]XP_041435278.1 hepatocyte cell adhesion molecule-like [Xenopus laevis]